MIICTVCKIESGKRCCDACYGILLIIIVCLIGFRLFTRFCHSLFYKVIGRNGHKAVLLCNIGKLPYHF